MFINMEYALTSRLPKEKEGKLQFFPLGTYLQKLEQGQPSLPQISLEKIICEIGIDPLFTLH